MNTADFARVLFTLLDAAADEGRIRDYDLLLCWAAVAERFQESDGDANLAALTGLLDELERRDALHDSWILSRWWALKFKCTGYVGHRLEPWCNARSSACDA